MRIETLTESESASLDVEEPLGIERKRCTSRDGRMRSRSCGFVVRPGEDEMVGMAWIIVDISADAREKQGT
jgi:hypothetical protein